MRALLQAVSIALLLFIFVITFLALYGSSQLPERVPSHLDASGHIDAWTTSSSFVILPILALVAYMMFSLVGAYSAMVKHPADALTELGPATEAMILSLITWIKAELVGIFACIQYSDLQLARHPEEGPSLLGVWILVGAIFCTVVGHVAAMFRAHHATAETAGPGDLPEAKGISE